MKVLVLAEYYPRAYDPVLGLWAHRQALAAREAGAEVRVLVLHRPLPSLRALRRGDLRDGLATIRQPAHQLRDGLRVDYLRYLSPPRPWSYASWGAWAALPLRRALARMRAEFPFELVHAHYAVPAGDAIRRAAAATPIVVSVHGADVHGFHAGAATVSATLGHARLVLANSGGTARRCVAAGANRVRVVHLGADVPATAPRAPSTPTLVTVGNLIERKRHADVLHALPRLLEAHPRLRYVIVGDGPERQRLQDLARSLGVAASVEFTGALAHDAAVARAQSASVFVLPSLAEAFGVSYVEAMAAGVPAVGTGGEDGPEEIAAAGGGIALVAPRDPEALGETLDQLLSDPRRHAELSHAARANVTANFTWARCGSDTVDAYRQALVTGAWDG